MRIARVFPRRTSATPDDEMAFTTAPPKELPEIDEVHVSAAFSYDMEKAEQLAEVWHKTGVSVKLGGPAFNEPGGEFIPGRYLKHGYVITSRGCPNRCPYCSVPQREGYSLRELPVTEGWNVLIIFWLAPKRTSEKSLICSNGSPKNLYSRAVLKRGC